MGKLVEKRVGKCGMIRGISAEDCHRRAGFAPRVGFALRVGSTPNDDGGLARDESVGRDWGIGEDPRG